MYKSVGKSKREKFFNEFKEQILIDRANASGKISLKDRLELLKQKEEKKKERDRKKLEEIDPKEARKRKREEALEAYNQMLKEKITNPDISWEDAIKLIENDVRYKTDQIFNEKKEKLFKSHRYMMFQERKAERKSKYNKQKEENKE